MMQAGNIIRIAIGTAFILLLLILVSQFSEEVDWTTGDFLVAGILLIGAGLAYELLSRRVRRTEYRVAVAIAIGIVFLLIWVELAVGLFEALFTESR